MKRTLFIITALVTFVFCSNAQNVNIPDANFKAYLLGNTAINTNGDAEIQVNEANSFTGQINCSNDGINDMSGIEAFTSLNELRCNSNNISSIDLSQNVALVILQISSNLLTYLDVSQNTNLDQLLIADNNFTSIDISQNINLTRFVIQDNNFTSIDLSQNTALTEFTAHNNSLTSLDVSNNILLEKLYCLQNNLSSLNMKNVSTILLNNFYATTNPNLTCIEVDNVADATAAWTNIDPSASFSLDCNYLVSSIMVQGQGGVSAISTQGGNLQMEASILPTYADNDTYTWSVANVTGSANIDGSGLLTALTDGTVTVTATANDASGITGNTIITISNQSVGINEQSEIQNLSIYPNPVKSQLTIDFDEKIETITILDVMGKSIKAPDLINNTVDVFDLTKGIYFLQINTDNRLISVKFIKE